MHYPNVRETLGVYQNYYSDGPSSPSGYEFYTPERIGGVNYSLSHPRSEDGVYREGGPWYMAKRQRFDYPSNPVVLSDGKRTHYVGSFVSEPWWEYQPNWAFFSDEVKNDALANNFKRGAEAWKKLRPDLPDFSAVTEILELRDIPGLLKNTVRDIRDLVSRRLNERNISHSKAAEWYLACNFGWLPILRSVKKFVELQRNEQKRFNQLLRDAGRPIRRRVPLNGDQKDPSWSQNYEYDRNVPYSQSSHPGLTLDWYGGGLAKETVKASEQSRLWAEGKFTYFLPDGPRDVEWKKRILRRIYGLYVTPSQVYNAMPWTWLFDWFAGLGDFLEATDPGIGDRYVADYAYIMTTYRRTTEWSSTQYVRTGKSDYSPVRSAGKIEWIQKTRTAASPFGFGLKEQDFTPFQASILAAIAAQKGGK